MFPINEIFHSLQGEGYNTGTASVFLRFSGCNLHCHFCDTQHLNHTMMSLPQLVEEVMKYPSAPLIVLTGGEPSLYVDEELIKALMLNRSNFGQETDDHLKLRQQEIASEWDIIEYTLQNDEYWLFLLNVEEGDKYKNTTRIDYIFDLICEQQSLGDYANIGTDEHRGPPLAFLLTDGPYAQAQRAVLLIETDCRVAG